MNIIRSEKDVEKIAERVEGTLPLECTGEWRDKSVAFTVDGIVSRQIETAYRSIRYSQQKLDEAVDKQKAAEQSNNGSEVSDSILQRATAWTRTMEAQLEFIQNFYESDMRKAQAAYLAYFDKKWVPYDVSRNIANTRKETAAALEAKEVSDRLAEQKQSREPLY